MKTLITVVLTVLTIFAAASFSFAQSSEPDSVLLAKAEMETQTVRDIITKREDPGDISLSTRGGPGIGKNPDLTYGSDSPHVEDFPLVISSGDKKTVSIVLPPFLYFKTQF